METSKKSVPKKSNLSKVPIIQKVVEKGAAWMKVESWLMMAKLITFAGMIILVASSAAGQMDGELVAYYWIAIGLIMTLITATVMVAKISKHMEVFPFISKMAALYMPTIATLLPVILMIIIFQTVRKTLKNDALHLPKQFYTFHNLTFFFIFLQILMLYKFLGGEIKATFSKQKANPNKWVFVSAFIFFGILSSGSAAELYVIITRFITDG